MKYVSITIKNNFFFYKITVNILIWLFDGGPLRE